MPQGYMPTGLAYAFPQESAYLPIFNYYIRKLREIGAIQMLKVEYEQSIR